jgi:hypothetical protein
MASSRQVITAILEAATGVTALSSTRIYPGHIPENPQHPYIVHWKISHPRTHAFGVDKSTGAARHQVRFVGKTLTSVEALALAAKTGLSRYSGTATGITVQDILLDDESDALYDPETGEYAIDHDYIVWHEES